MRVKKVNRYYCDFCGKGGCGAGHMRTHELHCTANPNRECRVCPKMQSILGSAWRAPLPSAELVKLIPPYGTIRGDETVALTEFRRGASGCPACLLAAIRTLNGTFWYMFDFKLEMRVVFNIQISGRVYDFDDLVKWVVSAYNSTERGGNAVSDVY